MSDLAWFRNLFELQQDAEILIMYLARLTHDYV